METSFAIQLNDRPSASVLGLAGHREAALALLLAIPYLDSADETVALQKRSLSDGSLLWEVELSVAHNRWTSQVSLDVDPSGAILVAETPACAVHQALSASPFVQCIAVFEPDGTLRWSVQLGQAEVVEGGTTFDAPFVAFDEAGDVLFARMDRGSGDGNTNVIVSKLRGADGNELWSTVHGSDEEEVVFSLDVGPEGHVYVGGGTEGSWATENENAPDERFRDDSFQLKVDGITGRQLWLRQWHEPGWNVQGVTAASRDSILTNPFEGELLAIDAVTGEDIWSMPRGNITTLAGARDVFLAESTLDRGSIVENDAQLAVFSANRGELLFAYPIETEGSVSIRGLWADDRGSYFVAGSTSGDLFAPAGGYDVFLVKLAQ